MNKKLVYSIIGIGTFLLLIVGIYCATTMQEKKIKQLESQVAFLKEEIVPIRFKILDRHDDTVFFSIKFYDMDRNVVYYYDENGEKQEYVRMKLVGNELAFDFIIVPVGRRILAFPYKVFTDAIAPKDGIVLFQYYNRDNFPQIYYSSENSPAFNAGIKALFDKIQKGQVQDIKGITGSLVQDVKGISQFEVGRIYKIILHPSTGGIEFVAEQ